MEALMNAAAAQKGTLVAALLGLGGLLGVLLRSVLPYRKSLIDSLSDRVSKLEQQLERERTARQAEVRILRHENANLAGALDLFIELIEAQPERAKEHAARAKERRARDAARLAEEKNAIRAAEIMAAGGLSEDITP